ncbi:MAG: hypothetical protein KF911_15050 [Pseudomonadales bacterium]|nr:hypothetical protein [Pseudomonadales bacterium]
MIRTAIGAALLVFAAGGAPFASAQAAHGSSREQPAHGPRGNVVRLMPQIILDATGFAQPMAAATIFVPHGWRAEGGEILFAFSRNERDMRGSMAAVVEFNQTISGYTQMIAETNDYIARLRQETWNAQQESADRRVREFGELMKGVETYRDASGPGGQTELSAHYSHAWRLNDGTYVLTNDAAFDPWRDLNLEGKKLEVLQ